MTADARPADRLGTPFILRFWLPLAATWLMMALEGPFLAALIARLPDPAPNLAAFGVAFAFAALIEAPVIMLMSASTALADSAHNFRRLRDFSYLLDVSMTLVMVLFVLPPVFDLLVFHVMGMPGPVVDRVHGALLLLLPWPGAIGYRRFHQGLLIRDRLTRRVTYGTVVRLTTVTTTGLLLARFSGLPGASVGTAALSAAVCAEAVFTRIMVRGSVRRLLAGEGDLTTGDFPLSFGRIANFYYPLALTSVISLAAHPIVAFFMGKARDPVASLAVLPVINAFTFLFRSLGLSYQEVMVALPGRRGEHTRELIRFALWLGLAATAAYVAVVMTPLVGFWFEGLSGLSPALAAFARPPARVLAVLPALAVLLSTQRGLLVHARRTGPITQATLIELGGIVAVLLVGIGRFELSGATLAAVAFLIGRVGGNLYLSPPFLQVWARSRPGYPDDR